MWVVEDRFRKSKVLRGHVRVITAPPITIKNRKGSSGQNSAEITLHIYTEVDLSNC